MHIPKKSVWVKDSVKKLERDLEKHRRNREKVKLAPRQRTKYGTEIVAQYTPMDEYNNAIYEAAKVIINYVKGKNGNYTPSNGDDSR